MGGGKSKLHNQIKTTTNIKGEEPGPKEKELDLVDPTSRERALKKLVEIQEKIKEEEKRKKTEEQLQRFKDRFLECSRKYLKLDKGHLREFKEDELPELGELLMKKVKPWAVLQGAALSGLWASNLAIPVGLACCMHPMMLLLVFPLGTTGIFGWKYANNSISRSYRKLHSELKKQFGAKYFPPKDFLLPPSEQ